MTRLRSVPLTLQYTCLVATKLREGRLIFFNYFAAANDFMSDAFFRLMELRLTTRCLDALSAICWNDITAIFASDTFPSFTNS